MKSVLSITRDNGGRGISGDGFAWRPRWSEESKAKRVQLWVEKLGGGFVLAKVRLLMVLDQDGVVGEGKSC